MNYYRIENMLISAGADEFDNPVGRPRVHVYTYEYEVLKSTPKGVWVGVIGGGKRFIRNAARKRFACPTVEEAKESFLARKRRQLSILRRQISNVEVAIEQIEAGEGASHLGLRT